jgi:CBS domain-containing protein
LVDGIHGGFREVARQGASAKALRFGPLPRPSIKLLDVVVRRREAGYQATAGRFARRRNGVKRHMDSTVLQTATVAKALQPYDTVSPDMPLTEAAALMREHHGRALLVKTDDATPAIFTEHDIIKVVGAGETLEGKTVGDCHTRVAVAATPDWSLGHAVDTMKTGKFRHLVVMDKGNIIGLIGMREVLLAMLEPQDHPEPNQDTVEFGAHVKEDAGHLLNNLRKGAKQHMSAINCLCELDWIEVLTGQAEERPNLSADGLQQLWELRPPCPVLNSMGGSGD